MFASPSFHEEGVERIISHSNGLVRGHLAIGLDSMLKTVELPAAISNLATCLTNVD